MIGAVIITHSGIGRELITTAEHLVGEIDGIVAVTVHSEMNAFEARKAISQAIKQVDQGDGVLLLTDLLGGFPCNIAFSFLNNDKVDVLTGVNLPMILTFWSKRPNSALPETAKTIQRSGMRSISRARGLLETKGDRRRFIPKENESASQGR
jgi:PTS system mannose-specific IIA component